MKAGSPRKPEVETVAVAAMSEDGEWNETLARAIAIRLQSETIQASAFFFTPEFVSDGLFTDTWAGSKTVLSKLELTNSLDTLVLRRQTVQYSTDTSLENAITASMQLEVMTLPVVTRSQSQTWTIKANGAGFKPKDARLQAEERLIQQIATDTNLFLRSKSPKGI